MSVVRDIWKLRQAIVKLADEISEGLRNVRPRDEDAGLDGSYADFIDEVLLTLAAEEDEEISIPVILGGDTTEWYLRRATSDDGETVVLIVLDENGDYVYIDMHVAIRVVEMVAVATRNLLMETVSRGLAPRGPEALKGQLVAFLRRRGYEVS